MGVSFGKGGRGAGLGGQAPLLWLSACCNAGNQGPDTPCARLLVCRNEALASCGIKPEEVSGSAVVRLFVCMCVCERAERACTDAD